MSKKSKINNVVSICVDCVGEIVSFLKSSKIFFNVMLVSKHVKMYFEVLYGHANTGNIMFVFKDKNVVGPGRKIPYVKWVKYTFKPDRLVKSIFTNLEKFSYDKILMDKHLVFLTGIDSIIVDGHHKFTDSGMKHIRGVKHLDLCYNDNVTDKGLACLQGVQHLDIANNDKITDAGLKVIRGVKTIKILWYDEDDITEDKDITVCGLISLLEGGVEEIYFGIRKIPMKDIFDIIDKKTKNVIEYFKNENVPKDHKDAFVKYMDFYNKVIPISKKINAEREKIRKAIRKKEKAIRKRIRKRKRRRIKIELEKLDNDDDL
jgi:hypothetical protein